MAKQMVTVIGRYIESPKQEWFASFEAESVKDALAQAWEEVLDGNNLDKEDREPDETPESNNLIQFLAVVPGVVSPIWCEDSGEPPSDHFS